MRSLLLASGRPCDIVDLVVEGTFTLDRVLDLVSGYRVLLFSCNSMNWATVQCIAQAIRKEHIGVKICVGGPHATSAPASVIRAGCFDALFQGDADSKIAEVYDSATGGFPRGDSWPDLVQVWPGATRRSTIRASPRRCLDRSGLQHYPDGYLPDSAGTNIPWVQSELRLLFNPESRKLARLERSQGERGDSCGARTQRSLHLKVCVGCRRQLHS